MRFDFQGQYAIVTGASSGIGAAIAQQLAHRGATVIITTTANKPAWIKDYSSVIHVPVDFLDQRCVESFLHYIDGLTRLDILVNNAGVLLKGSIVDLTLSQWRESMTINLDVPMQITQAAVKKMTVKGYGRILMISSIAAVVNRPGVDSYAASKTALLGLTRASAMDVANQGILVNALCPGHTQTSMMEKLLTPEQQENLRKPIPMGRFAQPEEIANMAIFLVSSINTYMTAQTVIVDGGVSIK